MNIQDIQNYAKSRASRDMKDQSAPRARRLPVVAEEPLIGSDRYDYADAFEIRVREPDTRSAEQFNYPAPPFAAASKIASAVSWQSCGSFPVQVQIIRA